MRGPGVGWSGWLAGVIASADFLDDVVTAFGLGEVRGCHPVEGGLSNDLFRLESARGDHAMKVMGVNAEAADFHRNLEQAYAIERAARRRGVPCPRPVEGPDGACLVRISGRWVRMHAWVDGEVPAPRRHAHRAGGLLANIHRAFDPAPLALDDDPWDEKGWSSLADQDGLPSPLAERLRQAAPALAQLEHETSASHVVPHVPSHGDLDPKNTLLVNGDLLALDWDAAGVRPAAREAVSVALDWSGAPAGFRAVLSSYRAARGLEVPAESWVFGGWVSSQRGWLAYNAAQRATTAIGQREVGSALTRLTSLGHHLDDYRRHLR